ncbi:hypothetical protein HMPREF9404_5070 [Eggerthella sp. HGA1]|nr:hypothetical protein HMPREF9404_5070 [Eggerthella sp. HGA1]
MSARRDPWPHHSTTPANARRRPKNTESLLQACFSGDDAKPGLSAADAAGRPAP